MSKKSCFLLLWNCFDSKNTLSHLEDLSRVSRSLSESFIGFMKQYYAFDDRDYSKLKNDVIFNIDSEIDFCRCILYYISGMTDNFAVQIYNEIIGF